LLLLMRPFFRIWLSIFGFREVSFKIRRKRLLHSLLAEIVIDVGSMGLVILAEGSLRGMGHVTVSERLRVLNFGRRMLTLVWGTAQGPAGLRRWLLHLGLLGSIAEQDLESDVLDEVLPDLLEEQVDATRHGLSGLSELFRITFKVLPQGRRLVFDVVCGGQLKVDDLIRVCHFIVFFEENLHFANVDLVDHFFVVEDRGLESLIHEYLVDVHLGCAVVPVRDFRAELQPDILEGGIHGLQDHMLVGV